MQSYLKSNRGRPKLPIHIRYEAEVDLWTKALRDGGISFEMPTHGKAIAMVHSLNMARASVRERDGDTLWDNMTVRRDGLRVSIGYRRTIFDNPDIKFFDASGNPLEVAEIKNEQYRDGGSQPHVIDPTKPLIDMDDE
jgi:hypothetical protein